MVGECASGEGGGGVVELGRGRRGGGLFEAVEVSGGPLIRNNFSYKLNPNVFVCFQCAKEYGVRVLVDAEQTYFQRLFDHVVLYYLMPQYNKEYTVIYNTIQAYLKVITILPRLKSWSQQRPGSHMVLYLIHVLMLRKEACL